LKRLIRGKVLLLAQRCGEHGKQREFPFQLDGKHKFLFVCGRKQQLPVSRSAR
jgi:hypothetical protein